MKRIQTVHIFLKFLFFTSLLALASCSSKQDSHEFKAECTDLSVPFKGKILIAGSGVNLPLFRKIAQKYQDLTGELVIIPSSIGSTGAIKALADNTIHIGLSSRPLKSNEKQYGIEARLLAYAPMVAASNISLKKEHFSMDMLCDIYSGKKEVWSDGSLVIPVFRENGDSGFSVIQKKAPLLHKAIKEGVVRGVGKFCYTEEEVSDYLSKVPGSIGIMDPATLLLEDIKLNKYALYSNLERKKPLFRPLYILTRQANNKAVSGFVDFCFSAEIKSFIKKTGYRIYGDKP